MADDQARAAGNALRALVAQAGKALNLEATANLIELCPHDTGHARANFVPSVGEPSTQVVDGVARTAQDAGIAAVLSYKLGDGPLYVTNHVPYLAWLIGGSSSQRPAGWDLLAIALAVQAIQAQYDGLRIDVHEGTQGPVVAFRASGEGG